MLSDLRRALVNSIVERVEAAKISDPVFSLVLAWDPGQDQSLPPHVGLGLERERSKWLQEHGDDAKSYLWNPAEYRVSLLLESKDLAEIYRCVNQECKLRNSWARVAKVLNNIAKDLSTRSWTGLLSTTEDFVAYATDLELTDFHRNLKASTPPSILSPRRVSLRPRAGLTIPRVPPGAMAGSPLHDSGSPGLVPCPSCTIQIPSGSETCPYCLRAVPRDPSRDFRRRLVPPEQFPALRRFWGEHGKWVKVAAPAFAAALALWSAWGLWSGLRVKVPPDDAFLIEVEKGRPARTSSFRGR